MNAMKTLSLAMLFALVLFPPALAFGQTPPEPPPTPCPPGAVCLLNPLGQNTTFTSLLNEVLKFLRNVGGIIASIMIIIGAFQILFASGDPERFRVGKRTIIYTVIAYGIIFMASAISSIVADFLGGGSTLPPSNPVR